MVRSITPVQDIDRDTFGVILSFLAFPNELSAVQAVCKSWYHYVSDRFWANFSQAKEIGVRGTVDETAITRSCRNLHSLHIDYQIRRIDHTVNEQGTNSDTLA